MLCVGELLQFQCEEDFHLGKHIHTHTNQLINYTNKQAVRDDWVK